MIAAMIAYAAFKNETPETETVRWEDLTQDDRDGWIRAATAVRNICVGLVKEESERLDEIFGNFEAVTSLETLAEKMMEV